jgi:hypothetical protein
MIVWMLTLAALSLFTFANATSKLTYEDKNGTTKSLFFNQWVRWTYRFENGDFIEDWSHKYTDEDLNMVKSPKFKFLELFNNENFIRGQVMSNTLKYPLATWIFYKSAKVLQTKWCTNFGGKLSWKADKLASKRKLDCVSLHTFSKSLKAIFVDGKGQISVTFDKSFNLIGDLESYNYEHSEMKGETLEDYEFSISFDKQMASVKFLALEKLMIRKNFKTLDYTLKNQRPNPLSYHKV